MAVSQNNKTSMRDNIRNLLGKAESTNSATKKISILPLKLLSFMGGSPHWFLKLSQKDAIVLEL